MKVGTKLSRRTKFYHCGIPVDTEAKALLRKRSIKISNAQRHVLRQMGVRVDKKTTEKDAVKLIKRIVTFKSAYGDPNHIAVDSRRPHRAKPKRLTERQHLVNVLVNAAGNGSNRAAKNLARL